MPYTATTWNSGVTPASAANMNNIETGVANAVTKNGDTTFTAAVPVAVTLGGADKVILDMTATDGKHYQLKIRASDSAIYLYDVTDSILMFAFAPAIGPNQIILCNTLPTAGVKNRIAIKVPYTP